MGTLIPNPFDQEIVARLNVLFDHHLTKLKGHGDKNNKLLDPSNAQKLHRIARRIGAFPDATDYQGRNPRARWYVFLNGLNSKFDPKFNPRSTARAILEVINTAVNDPKADRIVFGVAYEEPTPNKSPTVYVYPDNASAPATIVDAQGKKTYLLTLVVQELAMPVPALPESPNGKDSANENAIAGLPWGADDTDYHAGARAVAPRRRGK